MDEFYNKHYISVDDRGRVTAGWSDGPCPERETAGAVLLTDKGGYQFRIAPGGEENPCLVSREGVPLYAWDGEKVTARSAEEIAADVAALPKPAASSTDYTTYRIRNIGASASSLSSLMNGDIYLQYS